MSGLRMLLGWGVWLAPMLPMAGEELSTVAYVVDRAGFAELGSEWHWRDFDAVDPFAEEQEEEKFAAPLRLEHKPNGSRFFAEGDEMWLMTGTLRQQKVLTNERSWAVWNGDRGRLVVHGTKREHGWIAMMWSDLVHIGQVGTSVQLLKVRSRELGGVEWTEEVVKKRGAEVLHEVSITTRPGQKGNTVMATDAGDVQLEVEANYARSDRTVDLRLSYGAAVMHAEGVRKLTIATGLAVYDGCPVHVELGGADGAEETYLLGITSEVQFLDGTPRWRWREFEDESMTDDPWGAWARDHHMQQIVMDDGKVFVRAKVHPTFVEDLLPPTDGEDVDPFAPDLPKRVKQLKGARIAPMKDGPDVPSLWRTDVLLDLTPVLKDRGLGLPEGTWVGFNQTRSVLVGMLRPIDADLLDALLPHSVCSSPPRIYRMTASVIEWEGELEPGKIPDGAQRIARMGSVAHSGQVVSVGHADSEEAMKHGVLWEVEATTGANNRTWDVLMHLQVAGRCSVQLTTGLTLARGTPLVLPVGEEDWKQLGIVLEGQSLDGTGREWPK